MMESGEAKPPGRCQPHLGQARSDVQAQVALAKGSICRANRTFAGCCRKAESSLGALLNSGDYERLHPDYHYHSIFTNQFFGSEKQVVYSPKLPTDRAPALGVHWHHCLAAPRSPSSKCALDLHAGTFVAAFDDGREMATGNRGVKR